MVEVRTDGPTARLRVDDEGPGLREEDLERVFDRFYRAPGAPGGGTGLGLAIAAWIVGQHDGRIGVANRDGGGARFTVELPIAVVARPDASQRSRRALDSTHAGRRHRRQRQGRALGRPRPPRARPRRPQRRPPSTTARPHGQTRGRRPDRPRPGPRRSSPAPTRSSISRRSPLPSCAPTARPSGSTRCRPTTCSRRPSRTTVRRVVWASSETVLGLPFDSAAGLRADRRVDHAAPGVVVLALEARRRDDGRAVRSAERHRRSSACGSRTSWSPTTTPRFPSYWDDARLRKWNLWGYVDARDVAAAARLALEAPIEGAEICIVAAADTVMTRPSTDLMAEVFPDVPLRRRAGGRETLLSIDRARRGARLRAGPPLGRPHRRREGPATGRSSGATAPTSPGGRTRTPPSRRGSPVSCG